MGSGARRADRQTRDGVVAPGSRAGQGTRWTS
jgi:hypothetical protein